ncbi:response regulator [Fulvivirga sp. 29W222]|uniref:Response regulator n=1 Tax=Fulvivirga marina TaxID=2494733 RepID=A0A937FXT1_9BACT|nr:response regulator [Fulvivirga marina]MBL6446968.1 response regulator [Fulvivirga marina]
MEVKIPVQNKRLHILLVEDDEVDIRNVERAFKKNHIANPLHIARNGLEALDMLKGNNGVARLDPLPKVILLDLNMPKMGGLEFLQAIRNDPDLKSISVFVMTTSDEESDKFAAYNLNVAGYILKPLSFERFVKAVSILNHYWTLCEQL